jgi:hypothetical protein
MMTGFGERALGIEGARQIGASGEASSCLASWLARRAAGYQR